ncbi:hypothetical protein N752_01070 [Desulforamulus aquiferis]|nr:hypothetical protein N752_01070 [Desulforamulus aquiferis]
MRKKLDATMLVVVSLLFIIAFTIYLIKFDVVNILKLSPIGIIIWLFIPLGVIYLFSAFLGKKVRTYILKYKKQR